MLIFTLLLIMSLMNGVFKSTIPIVIILILCLFIYHGGNIAKWIYIVINAINIISLLAALLYGQVISNVPLYLNVITILTLAVSLTTIIVLIFSSSVKEFMYKQRD